MNEKNKVQFRSKIAGIQEELRRLKKLESELKRTEKELQKEKDKTQRYLNIAGVIIVVINAEQEVTLINAKGCEILGYKEKDIIGNNWFDNFAPERVRNEVKSLYNRLMDGEIESAEHFENPILTKSGGEKIVAWHNMVLRNEDGKTIGTLSSGQDVTELRRAEQELRESEKRYRIIVDQTGQVVYDYDMGSGKILWSGAIRKLTGFSNDEFQRVDIERWEKMVHPEDRKTALQLQCAAKKEVGKYHVEYKFRRKDGNYIYVEDERIFFADKEGKACRMLGVMKDITEQKLVEQDLQLEAELLNSASDSIFLHDFKGNFLYMNKAAYETRGYNEKELMSMNLHEMDVPEYAKQIESHIKGLLKTGSTSLESAHYRKDGSIMLVEVHSRIIEHNGEKLVLSIARDITERKRAEKSLEVSYDELHRVWDETISALAAIVEMRDPYTAGHQQRVAQLACAIGDKLHLPKEQIQRIDIASRLHDIGKISVPAEILSKPGKINEFEFDIIKGHPQIGHDILQRIELEGVITQIILQHHERMNGSSYPKGLSGKEILLEARILGVADVVEAMCSHRPYRPALGIKKALDEINRGKGTLYDPDVVDACLRLFTEKGFKFK